MWKDYMNVFKMIFFVIVIRDLKKGVENGILERSGEN